ncbi:MAG: TIGR03087 family PEP-CTERM/XrtA system glycosyltransferase [Magnetococcales bacterium]|nr:TIGR03087 family PEP-CTERM/XrtA system glycosyltransferase [Magnetococcales bacterium]
MDDLLFLAHRIPYPPDKGDKIRAYHLLRFLSQRYRIHLAAFVDDPADWVHESALRALCAGSLRLISLDARTRKFLSLSALWRGEPLTLRYYPRQPLQGWIDNLLQYHPIRKALVFSSGVAPFLSGPRYAPLRRVMDFVDVDSQKWTQYGQMHGGPLGWLYRREGVRLLAAERALAAEFDASLLVSPEEAALFRELAPESAAKIGFWELGVDADHFNPALPFANPYGPGGPPLLFLGAMDYRANVDAVVWFAREIWPLVRRETPAARFFIVGRHPTPEVRTLGALEGVFVSGGVADPRPHLAHAAVALAPLRVARGVQNKVLQAMAMGVPTAATRQAMEGIHLSPALRERPGVSGVEAEPQAFARLTLRRMAEGRGVGTDMQRQWMMRRYAWEENLKRVLPVLEGELPGDFSPEGLDFFP